MAICAGFSVFRHYKWQLVSFISFRHYKWQFLHVFGPFSPLIMAISAGFQLFAIVNGNFCMIPAATAVIPATGCSPLFDPSAACAVCSSDKKRCEMAEGLDIITRLPQAIIETILCLFPIEEAASTSIFSKEWRYRWTKIPKLVFCQSIVKRTSEISSLIGGSNYPEESMQG
ncbi:uncharacterized protein LOC110924098 [Helianthus annuus]|uniref:uncharacterized protein LOC110924098 n=1 Tax=Helianthus annuus TaxID=4232 RepID=UPI0016533EB8|nr:uncharacterized protein LOC110924098 [Helianthus annuus]